MDGAGALVGGDVGGEHAEDAALEERMLEGGVLELAALEAGEFCGCAEFAGGDDGRREFGGDDVDRIRSVESGRCSGRHWQRTPRIRSRGGRRRPWTRGGSMGWWSR